MSPPRVSAVLLASGLGRRFGGNKLLADFEGRSLFRYAFSALPASLFRQAAVVSAYDEILSAAKEAGYLPVFNPRPSEGQSLSVRLGLQAVGEDADGVLFAVCDQPWLRRESVEQLIAAWREAPEHPAALAAQGVRGNPVIFPARLFPALAALAGDVGGGAVLRERPEEQTLLVECSIRELRDLDHPETFPSLFPGNTVE